MTKSAQTGEKAEILFRLKEKVNKQIFTRFHETIMLEDILKVVELTGNEKFLVDCSGFIRPAIGKREYSAYPLWILGKDLEDQPLNTLMFLDSIL